MTPFRSPAVAAKFDAYPPRPKRQLLALRELIFRTAASTPGVGEIEEALKWGEPAYLTKNGAGSTVRIDWKARDPQHCAVFFNCQTGLVDLFQTLFPNDFVFSGGRALILPLGRPQPDDALSVCIAAALTYHLNKRKSAPRGKGRGA